MKMQRDHMVPCVHQIQKLLGKIPRGGEWVFMGTRGKPISSNTMIYACYRMGYASRVTIHGMRSLASTVLNESGLWTPDAIERQLAHVPQNEVRAAYNAALYWQERCRMMTWWNNWLDEKKSMGELLG
jgi:integrase